MKKVKKLLSLVLCLCMMCVSAVPIYAHTGASTYTKPSKIYYGYDWMRGPSLQRVFCISKGDNIGVKGGPAIKKVKSSNSKVCAVSIVNKSLLSLKGKSKGNVIITVTTKSKKTYKFRVSVNSYPTVNSSYYGFLYGTLYSTFDNNKVVTMRYNSSELARSVNLIYKDVCTKGGMNYMFTYGKYVKHRVTLDGKVIDTGSYRGVDSRKQYVIPNKKGRHKLVATIGNVTKTIYLVVK